VPDITVGMGAFIDVWSLARSKSLAHLPLVPSPLPNSYFGAITGLHLDGDARRDAAYIRPNANIVACNHDGDILYTIPALSLGFGPAAIAAVGDLDVDGCDDFVVGAFEYLTGQSRGAVILFSGKTGTPLRIHWGPQPFDFLNRDVRA